MKIVAVSQRIDLDRVRMEARDALDRQLCLFIHEGGGLPVPVPNLESENIRLSQWLSEVRPSAVVLSGGNDIGDCLERDATERAFASRSQ